VLPRYHLDRAEVLVAFDADFLGTWVSPVEFAAAYHRGRTLDEAAPRLSFHVQFESRLSLTGSIVINNERDFGRTIHQGKSVVDLADKGTPHPGCYNPELVALAMGRTYPAHLALTDNWTLPAGAFKDCGGPR
jgi:hypothetical protein